jgi:nicotinate-nucleotide adenylyltransferase
MRIGLFGGTFDPIHLGHLRSAEEVREAFSLDRIVFIPAANPPHRQHVPATPAVHRAAMARLAIADNPRFALSTVELSRPGKSYSIDTLRHFKAKSRAGDSLYWILGLDAFREIGSWKNFADIFSLCHLVVTSRPDHDEPLSLRGMPVAVRRLFCYDFSRRMYRHSSGTTLSFIQITGLAISASDIRGLLQRGRSIRYLVHPKVEKYIRQRRLYRDRRGGR